jgi:hypothetical protein
VREPGSGAVWFPVEFLYYDDHNKLSAFAYVREERGGEIPDGHYVLWTNLVNTDADGGCGRVSGRLDGDIDPPSSLIKTVVHPENPRIFFVCSEWASLPARFFPRR